MEYIVLAVEMNNVILHELNKFWIAGDFKCKVIVLQHNPPQTEDLHILLILPYLWFVGWKMEPSTLIGLWRLLIFLMTMDRSYQILIWKDIPENRKQASTGNEFAETSCLSLFWAHVHKQIYIHNHLLFSSKNWAEYAFTVTYGLEGNICLLSSCNRPASP